MALQVRYRCVTHSTPLERFWKLCISREFINISTRICEQLPAVFLLPGEEEKGSLFTRKRTRNTHRLLLKCGVINPCISCALPLQCVIHLLRITSALQVRDYGKGGQGQELPAPLGAYHPRFSGLKLVSIHRSKYWRNVSF